MTIENLFTSMKKKMVQEMSFVKKKKTEGLVSATPRQWPSQSSVIYSMLKPELLSHWHGRTVPGNKSMPLLISTY
jgi:hypothetical protein